MSSHRPARHDGDATAPWGHNGDAAPRPAPPVPKMGVRARIADWPPKRDAAKDPPGAAACHRAAPPAPLAGVAGFKALHRLARRRSKDVEFQEGWWPRSPARGLSPLRHRSSSEVTLSECDPEEPAEPRGAKLGGNAALFREYGSTSSIDAQGISEQSFFDMLNQFRTATPRGRPATLERPGDAAAAPAPLPGVKPESRNGPRDDPKDKARRRCPKGDAAGESIFKKLRSGRGDAETGREAEEPRAPEPGWLCRRGFAHYDAQSLLFDLDAVALNRAALAQRRNTTTGASAASAATGRAANWGQAEPAFGAAEDMNRKENLEHDGGDDTSNELLLSCPHFRNEIGGATERNLSFARAAAPAPGGFPGAEGGSPEPPLAVHPTNAGVSVLEVPKELQRDPERLRHFSVEHVDLGARYYRDYFHGKEHSNYFGIDDKLGPVAVSVRRERLDDHKDHGPQYQYRLIVRTSELVTLRGSILEDATPTAAKAGTVRGLPLRDVLEHVVPELNPQCLRLAPAGPRVPEQLLKLDEQGLCRRHKVGILYCKAGQSSEEEMYNNEEAAPPFEEFLALLGEKVPLRAFPKYAAQLDTKTDSTGTHSLYTTYQDYEIMFHVSTMLPYTPNNRQQLLRKRHIGNDIVTIIFQEPGALPFTPQNVRSHFQHVFIIVRAHQPCTERVSYSVAVTRSKDVPPFGPPIPAGVTFRKSEVFREFLLAKAINAENAAHKSDKFRTMATRTRQEYLRDLAENCVTGTGLDSGAKFNLMSLASKRREKTPARAGAERDSAGAVAWRVAARDFARGTDVPCVLGVSNELVVLVDVLAKEVAFNCFCGDVLGWAADGADLRVFHGRGDHVALRAPEHHVRDIVARLKVTTPGVAALELPLRRNGLGQLGFHVRSAGTVAEVEPYGFAWQSGLRPGSRLLDVCKVALLTMTHEQMIDLLRTSVTVTVLLLPPHDDGTPRRSWSETVTRGRAEPQGDTEPVTRGHVEPVTRSHAEPVTRGHTEPQGDTEPVSRGHADSVSRGHADSVTRGHTDSVSRGHSDSVSRGHSDSVTRGHADSVSRGHADLVTRGHADSVTRGHSDSVTRGHADSVSRGHSDSVTRGHSDSVTRARTEPPGDTEPTSPGPRGQTRGSGWHWGGKRGGKLPLPHGRRPVSFPDTPQPSCSPRPPSGSFSSPSPAACARYRWQPEPQDGDSSSGGVSSHEGTLERHTAEPLWHVPAQGWPPGTPRDSPGRQHKGDVPPSSGSSSATLSSNGSSSDDPPEPPPEPPPDPKTVPVPNPPPRPPVPKPPSSTTRFDPPRAPPGPQIAASGPKSAPSRSGAGGGRPLQALESRKPPVTVPRNVFGQPRLRASLRDLRPPRKNPKNIEAELRRLIDMDPPADTGTPPGDTRGLQRTLSDESLCGGSRRDAGATSASPPPGDSPTFPCSTLPHRRPPDRKGAPLPAMMPLPDTASGLEWASLVNAAKAYEVQRAVSLFSLSDPPAPPPPDRATPPRGGDPPAAGDTGGHRGAVCPPSPCPPLDLPGKVSQLEAMLRQLHCDLQKEKRDKVVLQAEVANLRHNNRRLQEESSSAARQLRRFARIFGTGDKDEL